MNIPSENFWKGKKVFLTGHTGFKGCWLMLWLDMLGTRVYGYSLAPSMPSLYGDADLTGKFEEAYADIRDGGLLREKMSSFAPDIVFHLAAQPLVRASYREPTLTYETNVMGTLNVLEAVRRVPSVKSAVVITTDKCYHNTNWEWGYRETDALGGADPYSSSKACAELVCSAWRSAYFENTGTLLASARAGNVIGGGDWAEDRLIPDAVRAFVKGEPLMIRSPSAVRPWQHVLEPLTGYLALAKRLYEGEQNCACAWNFGPSPEGALNVEGVIRQFVELWGEGAEYQIAEDHTLRESFLLRLDSSRAMQRLGWNPRLSFTQTLEMTAAWYRRAREGESPLSITREQILEYMGI